MYDSELVGEN